MSHARSLGRGDGPSNVRHWKKSTLEVDLQAPDCPDWCAGEHESWSLGAAATSGYETDDFIHSTEPLAIPVVSLGRLPDGTVLMDGQDLDVVLFQYQFPSSAVSVETTREEWVFIGTDESSLTVTRESAERLYRQLGTVLMS